MIIPPSKALMKTTPHNETWQNIYTKKKSRSNNFFKTTFYKIPYYNFRVRHGLANFPILPCLLFSLPRVFGQLALPEAQRQRFFQARFSIPAAKENFARHKIRFQIPSPSLTFQGNIGGCFAILIWCFKTSFHDFENSDFSRTHAPFADFTGAARGSLSHENLIPF
jgi:hypothetical protein